MLFSVGKGSQFFAKISGKHFLENRGKKFKKIAEKNLSEKLTGRSQAETAKGLEGLEVAAPGVNFMNQFRP
jgi:hypothetical protein